jgi:SAM-dependent methyltransferase
MSIRQSITITLRPARDRAVIVITDEPMRQPVQLDTRAGRARLKQVIFRVLHWLGLLKPFIRIRERILANRTRGDESRKAADGLPVPPAVLRMRVAGTGNYRWFLQGSERAAAGIRAALSRQGKSIGQFDGILDFGCGCGRVIRQWKGVARLHGCDTSDEAIAWCRDHLPFADFAVNGPEPPLRHADESLEFVYALSVFTHLARGQQRAWMRELRRILKPGGLLLLTTHGNAFADQLSADERVRYEAGDLVVRWDGVAGSNLCSAFHPDAYLRGPFSIGFEMLELKPQGALGNPPQDQTLLRKLAF